MSLPDIADVTVLDGGWSAERPTIILDADTAQEAVLKGAIEQLVRDALSALALSGKKVVVIQRAVQE